MKAQKDGYVGVRLDAATRRRLLAVAAREERTISQVIRMAVAKYLEGGSAAA